jgi:hypothetical protein
MYLEGEGVCVCVCVYLCHWESIYLYVCVFKGFGTRVSVFICVIESPSIYLFVSLRVWGIRVCGIRGVCVFEGLGGWSLVTIKMIKGLSH